MIREERIYSVLIVSAADNFNSAVAGQLPELHYSPVTFVRGVSAARREFIEKTYDFVIVNSPLPDDPGTRFAVDAAGTEGSVVLMLLRPEFYGEVREKVAPRGVFTLEKPLSRSMLSTALDWMASARERLRGLEKKKLSVEEKMEEIRTVNRAKWLLISHLMMDEPQAHRYLEKQAMDRCVTRKQVAEEIINTYS